ncbi:hypothetical protein MCOR07_009343 [Pyricularia oryzae]|uniref:Uncharacterized protein n=1 Tax=Pyricularia grisea TaxID=148305 RepID=A0ABQ8NJZ3_PYRGI|nr:hypothetical protein MCOR26_000835 [Pyricularia oryzae]KAI6297761.1 hypothetical protein MCOR33_006010 [Pyricularia grisea]KAI6332714.1 hypothetical protein MCOR29_001239 [Pyricularia oryzae]KAI6342086.1 hypothetical protein MCOR28_005596 [Pyricularia oryzae]KAI6408450.1 hypothetical protein MCOR23_001346 [Pyricularia oryzae]
MAKNCLHKAVVAIIHDGYIQVDVEGAMASSSVFPLSFAPLPVRRLCSGKRAASPSSWTQGTGPFPDLASTPPKQRFTGGRGAVAWSRG